MKYDEDKGISVKVCQQFIHALHINQLLSVGDKDVGKTCLIKRYCEGRFESRYITTIGVDYGVKKLNVQGKALILNIFDLSGDESYKPTRIEFYADSQAVLLCFSIGDRQSFLNISKWEKEMKDYGVDTKKAFVGLVGCKSDLKTKEVENSEIQKFARAKGWPYFQCSANNGENVGQLFDKLFSHVISGLEEAKKQFF